MEPAKKVVSPTPKVDVNFINPFVEETVVVMKGTCNVQAEKVKVFIRTGDQISGDVSAVCSMNSSQFKGSMAISFREDCFLDAVGRMLDEKFDEVDSEIADACGEICNQVFARARKRINESGYDIEPSIPSIIFGKGHKIKHLVNGPCIAVQFKTDAGLFTVECVIGQ